MSDATLLVQFEQGYYAFTVFDFPDIIAKAKRDARDDGMRVVAVIRPKLIPPGECHT